MQKDFDKNLLTPIYDKNFTEGGHGENLPQHNNAESIPFPGGLVVRITSTKTEMQINGTK